MKHLFYIHSSITYYIANSVIEFERIPKESCILIIDRDFEVPDNIFFECTYKVPFSFIDVLTVYYKFWKAWSKLKIIDHYLQKVTGGEQFIFYTPSIFTNQLRLVLKNKLCSGYNIIEEGLASYYELSEINKMYNKIAPPRNINSLIYRLNYKFRLHYKKDFLDTTYGKAYCVSGRAFPGFRNRVEMPFPFINHKEYPEFNNILILETLVESCIISFPTFLFAMIDFIDILLEKNIQIMYYKKHPEHYKNNINMYDILFKKINKGIIFKEVPKELSLEFIAGSTRVRNICFYCTYSSAGLYAFLSKRKVYSYADLISRYDKDFVEKVRDMSEKTTYLEPIINSNRN